MLKVKDFIDTIQNLISEGIISEDSEIHMTTDVMNFDESEIFETTFNGATNPNSKEQPSTVLMVGALKRIPNVFIPGDGKDKEDYRQFGSGYDVIEVTGDYKEMDLEKEIIKSKIKALTAILENFDKENK